MATGNAETGPSGHGNSPEAIPADYDLSRPLATTSGLRQGLTAYGDAHFSLFLRKAFIKALGYGESALARPIVGIADTRSGFNACHANSGPLIEAVQRGVQLAGALAVPFPTISLHESFAAPSSMFLRNLMAMDTEEMVRAQPVDVVVLVGGCDKTTPAQLMGALSVNKPVVHLVVGPMLPGSHRGTRVGACTDCRNNWARYRAGEMDVEDIATLNDELAPTSGTCGVMGTASTMACLLVALGMMPLNGATSPAVSAARLRMAEQTGELAVRMAKDLAANPNSTSLRPQDILSRASFLNALTVLQAIGGSTNAIVHLLAISHRHPALAGGPITLDDLDIVGRRTPLLLDLKPSGIGYMSDFHAAGGMPALLTELRPLLHLEARTVTGQTLGEALDATHFRPFAQSTIRPLVDPLYAASSLAVLHGNLAPRGAVLKASASKDRRLLRHVGPAVIFHGAADMAARLDDPDLPVTADSVLVLRGIGPVGHPGMPEAGLIPIPRKLAARGVQDMLRVSDGRMSGTAGGTIVLHVAPEGADPQSVLGLVQDGDMIRCDLKARVLAVDLTEEEIARRRAVRLQEVQKGSLEEPWAAREKLRGYRGLYMREVNQADEGCDFGFLTARGPTS